jgi:hypothetical protein
MNFVLRRQPTVASVFQRGVASALNGTGGGVGALESELALIRECDEVLVLLIKSSHRDSHGTRRRRGNNRRRGVIRYLEHRIARIATTGAATKTGLMAKNAVYAAYSQFRGKRLSLLALLLQTSSEEFERVSLQNERYELEEM